MNGARALLAALRSWDVRHVFCCPGTTEVPVLDALADPAVTAPEFVLTTHESVAVAMADGYARAAGRPGVAYLHTNVGLANGLAHLYAASLARSPVVVLAGVKPTATLPHRALTTTPQIRETARPYVGFDWQVLRADALVTDLNRAFWRSLTPPESPSLLVVPQDLLAAEVPDPAPAPARRPARQAPDPAAVAAAARAIGAARRPLIVAGADVARRGATDTLRRCAELLCAPICNESRRDAERIAYPTTDPHYAGLFTPTDPVVARADLILLAGCPTPLEFEPNRPLVPTGPTLVHLSENAGEPGLRLPTAHPLAGDTGLALRALLDQVTECGGPCASTGEFRALAVRAHREAVARWAAELANPGELSAAGAMRALAGAVSEDAIVVADAVTSTVALLRFLARGRADGFHATASGSLGWGMGAALGVALARPDRPVVAVVGDGVFQFGLPALWTAARYRIPVTFVVVNNGAYQAVVSGLRRFDGLAAATGEYPLTDIGGVDIAAAAGAFGLATRVVRDADDLAAAVHEPADGPTLLDVRVNRSLWP